MYVPSRFSASDEEAWKIVDDAGAGMLVLNSSDGLASVYVPILVSEDRRRLSTHVARANPWWRSVGEAREVLVLFLTASAYVSPSNYVSRSENPNVVPTWNYVAVEIRGLARVHDDLEWKQRQTSLVTGRFEQGRVPEWRADDLDERFREGQLKAIVGIEIDVLSIEGKAKLSQNRPEIDRANVRRSFAGGTLEERMVAERMDPPRE